MSRSMQTIVPDGQPECLKDAIATLHRYMMFRIGFSTVKLKLMDLTICCEKNREKLHLNVQCAVQRSCLTISRGCLRLRW